MTKLEAVNELLEAIKEWPVSTLDTGGTSTAAIAESTLDRELKRVLSYGWHENTDLTELTPDGSNEITLPSGTLSIRTTNGDYNKDLAIVDSKLYDRVNETSEFTETITLAVVVSKDLADLSVELSELVVKTAAVIFQRRLVGGKEQDAYLRQELAQASMRARRRDARSRKLNALSTRDAQAIIGARHVAPHGR